MLKYTKDHEWLRIEDDIATVGITRHAQEQLGDLVYVELPGIHAKFEKGAVAATVESVKATSEVYAPVGGEVVAVNERLTGEPGLVNAEPTGDGWIFKMRNINAADIDSLLDEDRYQALIAASDAGH